MARRSLVFLILLVLPVALATLRAGARGLPAGLEEGEPGTVAAVTDGDTLTLGDGRVIRLVGLQAPKLALGRRGFREWPLADEARAALAAIAMGRRVRLFFGGARRDRYGRWLAHLVLDDGTWVQGALLAGGEARVYSFPDNRTGVAAMLAIEGRARAARRGIWAHPFYRVRAPEEAARHIGSFQIVEGRVAATAVRHRFAYINFGRDYRSDFTVSIRRRALAPFRSRFGRRLERLEGQTIRVRGWLKRLNGPMIEATHVEQIEVLER